jgi:ATP-dependent DNA helicase RecQ
MSEKMEENIELKNERFDEYIGTNAVSKPVEPGSFEQRVALKILGCVKMVERKCGRLKLASILIGSPVHFAIEHGYNESIYFGALDMFTKKNVLQMIDGLIEDNYIAPIYVDDKPYPVLSLTDEGEAVLKDSKQVKFRLPWDTGSKPVRSPRNKRAYEALREMRRIQATIENVRAYKIMTNRAILDLAEKLPKSFDELRGIHGLGKAKISRYGALILQTLSTWSGIDIETILPSPNTSFVPESTNEPSQPSPAVTVG